jgi:hypothetical protein
VNEHWGTSSGQKKGLPATLLVGYDVMVKPVVRIVKSNLSIYWNIQVLQMYIISSLALAQIRFAWLQKR